MKINFKINSNFYEKLFKLRITTLIHIDWKRCAIIMVIRKICLNYTGLPSGVNERAGGIGP